MCDNAPCVVQTGLVCLGKILVLPSRCALEASLANTSQHPAFSGGGKEKAKDPRSATLDASFEHRTAHSLYSHEREHEKGGSTSSRCREA